MLKKCAYKKIPWYAEYEFNNYQFKVVFKASRDLQLNAYRRNGL